MSGNHALFGFIANQNHEGKHDEKLLEQFLTELYDGYGTVTEIKSLDDIIYGYDGYTAFATCMFVSKITVKQKLYLFDVHVNVGCSGTLIAEKYYDQMRYQYLQGFNVVSVHRYGSKEKCDMSLSMFGLHGDLIYVVTDDDSVVKTLSKSEWNTYLHRHNNINVACGV